MIKVLENKRPFNLDSLYQYIRDLFPESSKMVSNCREYDEKPYSIFFGKWLINFNLKIFSDEKEKLDLVDTEQYVFKKDKIFYDEISLNEFLDFLKTDESKKQNVFLTKTGAALTVVK